MITAKQYRHQQRGKRNARAGNRSEEHVCALLRRMGYVLVEPVHRAWIIQRKDGKIVGAIPAKKVSGDISAMTKDGRKVLAEVKSRETRTRKGDLVLRYSALEQHQIAALDCVARHGGVALLVWYKSPHEILVMDWPVQGFGPRKSLAWDQVCHTAEFFPINKGGL